MHLLDKAGKGRVGDHIDKVKTIPKKECTYIAYQLNIV